MSPRPAFAGPAPSTSSSSARSDGPSCTSSEPLIPFFPMTLPPGLPVPPQSTLSAPLATSDPQLSNSARGSASLYSQMIAANYMSAYCGSTFPGISGCARGGSESEGSLSTGSYAINGNLDYGSATDGNVYYADGSFTDKGDPYFSLICIFALSAHGCLCMHACCPLVCQSF